MSATPETKEKALSLGIEFHHATGEEKLQSLITEKEKENAKAKKKDKKKSKKTDKTKSKEEVEKSLGLKKVTEGQRRQVLRERATRKVRVSIQCRNPAKKAWPGEIIEVGNDVIGVIKEFVPFNDKETHVSQMVYDHLKNEREYQGYESKMVAGKSIRVAKNKPEFQIFLLDNLTGDELESLADKQQKAELTEEK